MAFCGVQFSDEPKDEEKAIDHSLKGIYAFSTKKKQMSTLTAEGLLTMDKNRVPVDRRIKVRYCDEKFNYFSYRVLCQLRAELPNGKGFAGSCQTINVKGVLNTLTCAHNLVGVSSLDNHQVKYKDGYAYQGRQDEAHWSQLFKLDGKNVRVHPKYNGQPDSGFDIGVCPITQLTATVDNSIWLKKPKHDTTWGSAKPEELKKGMKIEIAGFPGEHCGNPYTHTGEIAAVTKTSQGGYLLWYTADASPGNSGSPIMIIDEKYIKNHCRIKGVRKMVIGIHTGHDDIAELNFGTLMTPTIRKWMKNEP